MKIISVVGGADSVSIILVLALVIVSVCLLGALLVSAILKIRIFFAYWVTNRQKTEGGYTGETAAKKLLSELGYDDVQVKLCGFFRMLLYSNHYNPTKNTIYLRRSIFYGRHLTAIGIALQKVGLVNLDRTGGGAFRARWKLMRLAIFGPILYIPIVLVGVVLDIFTYATTGAPYGTLITAALATAFFIACLVLSFLNVKVEGRANRETLEIMKGYDFLTPDEQKKVAKVFRIYLLDYINEFIINIFEVIRFILKLLLQIFSKRDK